MIVWPGHLAAHMPKTGGTWLSEALRPLGRDRLNVGHAPLRSLGHDWQAECYRRNPGQRADITGRTLVGTIRDPWSWYGSLYLHALQGGPRQRSELLAYGDGSLEFREVLFGMTHPTWHCIHEHPGVVWRTPASATLDLVSGIGGLWSWATRWFYQDDVGDWLADVLLDCSQLRTAAEELVGAPLPLEPVNVRQSGGYASWYDPEMLAWVLDADGPLSASLGYRSAHQPAASSVVHLAAA